MSGPLLLFRDVVAPGWQNKADALFVAWFILNQSSCEIVNQGVPAAPKLGIESVLLHLDTPEEKIA